MAKIKLIFRIIILYILSISCGYADIQMKLIGATLKCNACPYEVIDDHYDFRYQFPCLDNRYNPKYIMALVSHLGKKTLQAFRIEDTCNLNQNKVLPVYTYLEQSMAGPGLFYKPQEDLYAFRPGLYFLIRHNSKWQIRQANKKDSLIFSLNEFPNYFDQTYQGFAYANDNIIFGQHNKKLLDCKHSIHSFHLPNRNHQAIGYISKTKSSGIQIKVRHKTKIIENQGSIEIGPKFSQNLVYVAFLRSNGMNWEIVILRNDTFTEQAVIQNLRMYDIENTIFFFNDSFQWLDNKLYYHKTLDEKQNNLTIFQYDPLLNKEKKIIFNNNAHFEWKQINKIDSRTCELNINIYGIGWFQVSMHNGRLLVAAECELKTKSFCLNKPIAKRTVHRIGIFEEQSK